MFGKKTPAQEGGLQERRPGVAGMWGASQSSPRDRESQGAPPHPTLGTEAMSHLLFKLPGQEFKADKKCLPSYLCYSFKGSCIFK